MIGECSSTTALTAYDATIDLVALVKRLGSRALPPGFDNLPHMKQPQWPIASTAISGVQMRADLYRSKGYGRLRAIQSLEPVAPGQWLNFTAYNGSGIPFGVNDFEVHWRITNTDEQAFAARQLRGGFEDPHEDNSRWERLEFRGVHLVEAFVLRRRTSELLGKSPAFKVVIE